MKTSKYIAFALTGLLLASCMSENFAEPQVSEKAFGNQDIKETQVLTIAQLKEKYAAEMSLSYQQGRSYRKITDDIQIKGIVTSSDEAGNFFNEIAIQDNSGAIIIGIAQSGLSGTLPIGTEILVDLKDLYVGNYAMQPEIGALTSNEQGDTYVGAMNRATWDQHHKILSTGNKVVPEVFAVGTTPTNWNLFKDCGKLGVLRNVTPLFWTESHTMANHDAGPGSKAWYFKEQDSNIMLYNSNLADFANDTMPNIKMNITGIFKRYRDTWEIIIRNMDDIEVVTDPYANIAGTGKGTEDAPYDVARALSLVANGANDPQAEVYIKGIISDAGSFSSKYGSITYFISNDGSETNQLKVYGGKNKNGAAFTAGDQIKKGQTVVIRGKLITYKDEIEVASNNRIISIQ